jgi:pyrimidine-nucleoside phosphorylase
MLRLGDRDSSAEAARSKAEEALSSGAALQRFVRLVEAQGGDASVVDDPQRLATAPERSVVTARSDGVVVEVSPRALGEGVIALGGGRVIMHQPIDPGVGFELAVATGDVVAPGDPVGVVHARDPEGARIGAEVLAHAVRLGRPGEALVRRPLVSLRVEPPAG